MEPKTLTFETYTGWRVVRYEPSDPTQGANFDFIPLSAPLSGMVLRLEANSFLGFVSFNVHASSCCCRGSDACALRRKKQRRGRRTLSMRPPNRAGLLNLLESWLHTLDPLDASLSALDFEYALLAEWDRLSKIREAFIDSKRASV